MFGEKVVPCPRSVPPVEAFHQCIIPSLAAAPRVTIPAPQREAEEVLVIVGIGITVIVKVIVGPGQSILAYAYTLIVSTIVLVLLLIAVKEGTFTTPFASLRPIAVLEFAQTILTSPGLVVK